MAIRNLSDGSERFLTTEAVVEEAAGGFSPDSQLFAFRSNREGPWAVYVVAVSQLPASRPVRIVQLESLETRLTASWTSRGLVLKMSNSQTDLYRVNVDGAGKPVGDPVRLTRESLSNRNPLVSPDGKRVAYMSRLGGSGAVEVMDANGANRRTARTAVVGEILGWKSATTLVIVSSTAVQRAPIRLEWNLQLLDIGSGQLTQAGPPLQGSGLQYAPGTNEIVAWVNDGNDLQVRSLEGGNPKIIKMSPDFFDFTVSRTGRFLSYSTADEGPDGKKQPVPGETRLMNLQTGDDRLLLKYADSRSNHGTLEFSADDRFLLYTDPSGIIRGLNLQTLDHWPVNREQANVSGELLVSGIEPSWSPDGTFVVLGGRIAREALRMFEGVIAAAVTRAR